MKWWDTLAFSVQAANRASEAEKSDEYEVRAVKRSIIYTREDVALIAVHLSSVNRQLSIITLILSFALGILFVLSVAILRYIW